MGKLALVLGCVAAASPNALCGSGFFVTTAGVATAPALYFLIVAPQVSALFESSDFRPRLAKLSVALSAALILIEYGALVALAVGRREGVYAVFGFEQALHFAALAMALATAGPFEAWAGPSVIRWGSFALGALSLAASECERCASVCRRCPEGCRRSRTGRRRSQRTGRSPPPQSAPSSFWCSGYAPQRGATSLRRMSGLRVVQEQLMSWLVWRSP